MSQIVRLTETQRKALLFLKAHPRGVKAAEMAEYLWPESNMHRKVSNQGHGACRGKAAWLCGGAYLSKLKKRKLVYVSWLYDSSGAYCITEDGSEALRNAEGLNRR